MEVRWLLVVAGWYLLGPRVLVASNGETEVQPEEGEPKKLVTECANNSDCDLIINTKCDETHKRCVCKDSHPINVSNECLPTVALHEPCRVDRQCSHRTPSSHCAQGVCNCTKGHHVSHGTKCIPDKVHHEIETPVDPTMIGVLVGLVVMFIVMCIVLRMFSKARFREHRTIFNSPRLMKLSLAKTRNERRASHASIAGSRPGSRAGSRHASIQSGLNIANKSPTHSQRGSRESIIQNNVHNLKEDGSPVKIEPLIKVESPSSPKDKKDSFTGNNIAAV